MRWPKPQVGYIAAAVNHRGCPVHLILPDAVERAACFRVLASGSRIVRCFASADDWIEARIDSEGPGAILLFHWRQPGSISGAALLERITLCRDITAFVAADQLTLLESRAILRSGACDLLPAPLDPKAVRRAVDAALDDWCQRQAQFDQRREAEVRLAALTPRERSILGAIAAGLGNKAIARQLDLSPRTVEVHRAKLMRRAGAGNVAELLRWQFIAEQARGATANSVHFGA
ncbi:MAG: helix-turn-helix transcriptional regulator [Alphaproteobacteria bacterium HGW-Alphaproteobacteria-17]|nr:MAG: helix-turn-helix transcriptional regulator [Alphaproteobacteria bacterium HGW-Alphaproteobacteria-17]